MVSTSHRVAEKKPSINCLRIPHHVYFVFSDLSFIDESLKVISALQLWYLQCGGAALDGKAKVFPFLCF